MGMFDDVIVEIPISGEAVQEYGWQTKDMDCVLGTYRVCPDGSLMFCGGNIGDQWARVAYTGAMDMVNSTPGKPGLQIIAIRFVDGVAVETTHGDSPEEWWAE